MRKTKKVLASLVITGMLSAMIPFNALAQSVVPNRIGGYTAAQTAAQIAEQTGWTGTAILASPTSFGMVDALTAGPLATFLKAPILLQEAGDVLNTDTKAVLEKLKVKTVYVTSGTAVISQAVLDQLIEQGIKVIPLGGSDRFETSVNIAKQMVALGANISKVAVAYGWLNQDALSIAAIAAAQTQPILLTEKDTIPASVKGFLADNPSIKTTHVIGGTAVISDTVKAQLPNATRLYGDSAYDTNVAVLKAFDSVLKYDNVFIANGETAIDALAGVPLAAMYKAGIVLTKGALNEGIAYVKSKMTSASVVTALGGTAVVPEVVRTGAISTAPPTTGGGGGGGWSGVRDTVAPVITLVGSPIVHLAFGATYTDAGATALDNIDGVKTVVTTITNNVNAGTTFNSSVAATYTFHYNVKDAAGNAASEVTRTVIVAPAGITLVNNATQLTTAVTDPSVTNIQFTGNITNPALTVVDHSVTIDFGAYVLNGDLSFDHLSGGQSVLIGAAGTRINGSLTVDTVNASFNNGVVARDGVNIVNIKVGTWIESANGNIITITDPDGATITIEGTPGSITVSPSATGGLIITVNANASIGNIISDAPMNLIVEAGGTIGTVTANAPMEITVGVNATVNNITIGANAGGSNIINNGATGNIEVQAGATGTTVTNNGTVNTVIADALIILEGTNDPGTLTVGAGGSVLYTGDLAVYITAVNNATTTDAILTALKALADISPLDKTKIIDANASLYIVDFALPANPTTTVTQIRGRVDIVNAAKKAIMAAIADAGTKLQATYTPGSWAAMQAALTTAISVNTNATATVTVAQLNSAATALTNAISGLVVMPKITSTTIFNSALTDNSLTFSLDNLTKSSEFRVSKDLKLSISIGASGPIGDFILLANQPNSILSSPLPANLNLSQTNMTAIFDAIVNLDATSKRALLDTVDFTKLFGLVQASSNTTQMAVYQSMGFSDLYKGISAADAATKVRIMDNMTKVIGVSLTDAKAADFRSSVVGIMSSVVLKVPDLTEAQKTTLVNFYLGSGTSINVTELFTNLKLTIAQKQSILDNLDYKAIFDAMETHLSTTTRAEMFKAVNFTDLFNAVKSADAPTKTLIYGNMLDVMSVINNSTDISRVEVLNALVFEADSRDAFFQILTSLDTTYTSTKGYVTITATLKDSALNTNIYTFKITR